MIGSRLILSFVLAASISVAFAQMPEGRVYALHSKAAGACPSLDWHIVLEPNGILAGMISWNGMKTMARAAGTVNHRSHTFTMIAKEMEGQARSAKITGQIREDSLIMAHIEGPHVICDVVIGPSDAEQPAVQ